MSANAEVETKAPRSCPDDGTCHHACDAGPCFRVRACGPLSGVFPDNRWPQEVREEEAAREQ
jgi:hypothetical protein